MHCIVKDRKSIWRDQVAWPDEPEKPVKPDFTVYTLPLPHASDGDFMMFSEFCQARFTVDVAIVVRIWLGSCNCNLQNMHTLLSLSRLIWCDYREKQNFLVSGFFPCMWTVWKTSTGHGFVKLPILKNIFRYIEMFIIKLLLSYI